MDKHLLRAMIGSRRDMVTENKVRAYSSAISPEIGPITLLAQQKYG